MALQVFRAKAGANIIRCEVCHSCKLQENMFARRSLLLGCIRKLFLGPYKGNLLFTVDLFKKADVKLGTCCLFIGLAMAVMFESYSPPLNHPV